MRVRSTWLTLLAGVAIISSACGGGGGSSPGASNGGLPSVVPTPPTTATAPAAPTGSIAASTGTGASPAPSDTGTGGSPAATASVGASSSPAATATASTGASPSAPASAGTGASPSASTAGYPVACTGEKLKVGLVTDVGRINDKSFNQSAYEGLTQAEAQLCVDGDYIETTSQSDYAKNIAEFADNGYNVVIGVGFLLGDALGDAAKEHPDIKFISIDGIPGKGHDETWNQNGQSLFFAEDQAGYLAGVLAASLSQSGTIGVVGGINIPPVERYVEGYINGAKSVKSDIAVKFVYIPSFTEPDQGKQAGQQMITQGADVLFGAGGLTGNGALFAACDAGKLAIGVDTDQYNTLPEARKCLVSSALKQITPALFGALQRITSNQFTAGAHVDDASTQGVGLAPFHDLASRVSPELQGKLDATLKGLADGSIKTNVVQDGKTQP